MQVNNGNQTVPTVLFPDGTPRRTPRSPRSRPGSRPPEHSADTALITVTPVSHRGPRRGPGGRRAVGVRGRPPRGRGVRVGHRGAGAGRCRRARRRRRRRAGAPGGPRRPGPRRGVPACPLAAPRARRRGPRHLLRRLVRPRRPAARGPRPAGPGRHPAVAARPARPGRRPPAAPSPRSTPPPGTVAVVDAPFLARGRSPTPSTSSSTSTSRPAHARAGCLPTSRRACCPPGSATWRSTTRRRRPRLVVRYDRPSHPALLVGS